MARTSIPPDELARIQQWAANNVRVQDGTVYQRQADGSWVPAPNNQVRMPALGSGSNVSFNPGGGPGAGGFGVSLPLFGAGAERPTIPGGGGATGPGGATFRPGTPAPPMAGSGNLGTNPFAPPSGTPAPTPPSAPVSAATPGAGTGPPAQTNTSTTDEILAALKKWGPVLAAGGKMAADWRAGRQDGRTKEQAAATINNTTNTNRYLAGLGGITGDINQRNYLGDLYDRSVDNAFRGGYASGVEDIDIPRPTGVPTRNITGGLRPSAFTNRKEIGAAMTKEAMEELLDPTRTATDPRPATKRLPALPTLPEKIDIPEPGAFDKALEYLGYGASALPFLGTLIDVATPDPKPRTPTAADLPISRPDPLVPQMPNIPLGDAPIDPYGTQGLIDTLKRRRTGPGGYFADPRF